MVTRVTEATIREAPVSSERLRAANYDAGEIRAKALEGFGQQLSKVADAAEEISYKYDLAEAKNADSADAIELAKIRAEALTAVGADAPKAAEAARQAADELRKTRLSTLKGRRGQLYSTAFDQRMAAFEGQITEHSIKQADVAERGAAGARAETSIQLAVDGYSDPEVWTNNMATAEAEYKKANAGKAPDELNRGWYEQRSKAHVAVAKSIMTLNPDDPLKAEAWIDDHAKEIAPEHEPELRKSLQPLIEDQQSDADFARAQAFGTGEPDAALPEGEDDHDAPTPATPIAGPKDLTSHLVGKHARVTDNATAHRLRGSGNALDIAAPYGTVIRPPMSGKVVKSWLDTEHGGGWSMLIQHPNGMVTGYAHMKSKGYLDVGAEVDSTTAIGAVGQTGKATGPHLHFTVRDTKGVKVDPQSVDWAATAGSGGPKTVDPTKVKWKEGELPRYDADKNAVKALTDNIYELATKEGWSRQRYDRAIAKAKDFAATSETMYNAQYDDFKDKVWGKIAELDGGDALTSVAQLGPDYGNLEGPDQLTVKNLIQANKKRIAEGVDVKANGEEYVDWRLMAVGSPTERQEFLKQDFRANPAMTSAERARLSIMQQDMKNDEQGTLAADQGRIRTYVNRYSVEAGFDATAANKGQSKTEKAQRAQRAQLIDRTTMLVQREQQRLGRPLSDTEVDSVVRSQVVQVTRDGETMPLYVARDKGITQYGVEHPTQVYENIPIATRDAIIRSLQRRGIPPTARLVIETYLEGSK